MSRVDYRRGAVSWRARAAQTAALFALSLSGNVAEAAPPERPPASPPSAPSFTPPGGSGFTPAPYGYNAPYGQPAYGQPGYGQPSYGQPYAPQPYPAAPRQPEPKPPRDPRVANAHADRVVLLPTTYTHPEGTVYLSSTEIVILQAGYALTDNTQITLTGTPPLGEDAIFPVDLSLKTALVSEGPVRFAAIGSITGLVGLEEGNFFLGRIGAVSQLCLDDACESSANIGTTTLLAGPATLALTGVGFVWRVADWAALLLEVDTILPLGEEAGEYNGVAVLPAFRLPYRTWSLDLGIARALDAEPPEDEDAPEVIPVIVFSYRFLP